MTSRAHDLARELLDPGVYPAGDRPHEIRLAETHISWLFITDRFVYKVKKPVDYGFLDFTALERRRFYCEEEVRLNRRLSPDVYLGVVVIRERDGRLTMQGDGPVVDYAVQMRRLPDDRWLSGLLDRGEATPDLARRLARRIAAFHAEAPTGERIREIGGLAGVRRNTSENFAQTEDQIGHLLPTAIRDRVKAYTEAFLTHQRDRFLIRETEGRIRDGHGDLHADQICVENGLAFIDCIEFNERFRYGDVAADIAFPAMDIAYHGRPDLADVLVEAYIAASGDEGVRGVLDFYRCYRAYTRGKVRGFRACQAGLSSREREAAVAQAGRYYALAGEYAAIRGPLLIAVGGLIGTGKTTVAAGLAERLGADVFSSDLVRKELAGLAPDARRPEPFGSGIYAEAFTRRTYDALHARAAGRLEGGGIVIIDASYGARAERARLRETADRAGAPLGFIDVQCDPDIVRERLRHRRGGPSDGRLELVDAQRAASEPPDELPSEERLPLDTSGPLEQVLFAAVRLVYDAWLDPGSAAPRAGGAPAVL